jgi:hypothetical protein
VKDVGVKNSTKQMNTTISDHEREPVRVDASGSEAVGPDQNRGLSPADPFRESLDHILAELERIDLLVAAQVGRARQSHKDDEFQGLYISEQEVDALMAQPIGLPRWAVAQAANADPDLRAALDHLRARIDAREKASIDRGILLRLVDLTSRFQLSGFDVDVLLICLAAEIDLRYERLYAYLQDDVTKKCPSVDLALSIYQVKTELKDGNWHVDYELKGEAMAGGGLHYIISARTGTILERRYEQ